MSLQAVACSRIDAPSASVAPSAGVAVGGDVGAGTERRRLEVGEHAHEGEQTTGQHVTRPNLAWEQVYVQ